MINPHISRTSSTARFAAVACGALLLASSCASDDPSDANSSTETSASTSPDSTGDATPDVTAETTAASDTSTGLEATAAPDDTTPETTATPDTGAVDAADGCEAVAALFVTRGSANPDLDDPEVEATCDGDTVVVDGNAIPDYTYIETSPGQPRDRDQIYSFPSSPIVADTVTPVPYIGTSAVTLGGIPIFGPTEGTGGDVESLPGILSDCGSHNGPSGFHIHLILTSSETDCLFTPEEVAAEPQLVGYAFDGFPIYTGIDQYTSSWQLTDETLFATDTWAAHEYVEGSGDLDECNGLYDSDGDYAYYTTATFPYIMGCYTGIIDLEAAGGGGGGGGGGDAEGERPERPEDDASSIDDEERPERPEEDAAAIDGGERPERPDGGAGEGERPERPDAAGAPPEGDGA